MQAPSAHRTRRLVIVIAAALALGVAIGIVGFGGGGDHALKPGAGPDHDPLAWQPGRDAALEARAAAGEAQPLYAKSPGGVVATAARVDHWRPLVEASARRYGIDPDMLEAVVFLESAGRPNAQASNDLSGAAGLTQILAGTATQLLGMHVDLKASARIAKQIAKAQAKHQGARVHSLEAARRRADQRFEPAKALDGTGRYIHLARGKLGGRVDLAFESYHMGIGNLQDALRGYGSGDVSYTQLYFDTTPLRHPKAYAKLSSLGDDSATYFWRLLAARDIMRLYRSDRSQLAQLAALHNRKATAEEVLHPLAQTQVFETPAQIPRSLATGALRPLPSDPAKLFLRIDPGMGEFAPRFHVPRSTYRALRPEALALLVYLAAGVHAISGQAPLVVTSSVRDTRYQKLLVGSDIQATRNYSLHTTGFAFDIARRYRSVRQARAFQFMLDRLQALNLIAFAVEPDAIHITVSRDARVLEPLLPKR